MKNIDLTKQDYEVADGKVVITSDELLNMIQSDEVAIDGEEENALSINFGCKVSSASAS